MLYESEVAYEVYHFDSFGLIVELPYVDTVALTLFGPMSHGQIPETVRSQLWGGAICDRYCMESA